jgi:hypothetical protein
MVALTIANLLVVAADILILAFVIRAVERK